MRRPWTEPPLWVAGLEALSCDTALTSSFSKVGPVPLGVLGLFYFSFWTLDLRAFQRTGEGIYRWVYSWVTALGALVSIALPVVLFVVLRAPCPFTPILDLSVIRHHDEAGIMGEQVLCC